MGEGGWGGGPRGEVRVWGWGHGGPLSRGSGRAQTLARSSSRVAWAGCSGTRPPEAGRQQAGEAKGEAMRRAICPWLTSQAALKVMLKEVRHLRKVLASSPVGLKPPVMAGLPGASVPGV